MTSPHPHEGVRAVKATDVRRARDSEHERWTEFGAWLAGRRTSAGLRVRDAAKRAGLPESEWRMLESGFREVGGVRVLPNPGTEVLARVAEVLGVPVEDVLRQLEQPVVRPVTEREPDDGARRLAERFRRLSPADRHLVEQLVERMLRDRSRLGDRLASGREPDEPPATA